jgi:hypothetical protein
VAVDALLISLRSDMKSMCRHPEDFLPNRYIVVQGVATLWGYSSRERTNQGLMKQICPLSVIQQILYSI